MEVTSLQLSHLIPPLPIPDESDLERGCKTKNGSTHHCQDRNEIIQHPLPTPSA
jgi:hypothetical protein